MPFRLVLFLGSFLLFAIQPLVGRAILPLYGGGAGVWLTCLLFFQLALLLGYGYVHGVLAGRSFRAQLRIQGLLFLLALASLAFGWGRGGAPLLPGVGMPGSGLSTHALAILATLTLTCAFPFLLLSTTSPLIQSLYARTHPGKDPYPLYALSNWGNVAGLLVFPLALEPFVGLHALAWGCAALFTVFGGLLLALLHGARDLEGEAPAPVVAAGTPEAGEDRPLHWVLLAALGTVWLLAVSSQISRDLAAMPLLWVPPMLAYLGSFILVFEGRWDLERPWIRALIAFLLALYALLLTYGTMALAMADRIAGVAPGLAAYLRSHARIPGGEGAVFFIRILLPPLAMLGAGLLLHGALARSRPRPSRLTRFYFFVAVGGALGGAFVSIAAPLMFRGDHELPAVLLLTSGLALRGFMGRAGAMNRLGLGGAAVGVALGLVALLNSLFDPTYLGMRDFFGTVEVTRPHPLMLRMMNGGTIHGQQYIKAPLVPAAYYGEASGLGRTLRTLQAERPAMDLGFVGMGVGNVAGYLRPGDHGTFFEISPKVIALAGPKGRAFNVISSAKAPVEVQEGDGRLLLQQGSRPGGRRYDLLLIDAFAGGHIPAHLLTIEALRTYFANLKPDGVLVLHVSHHLPLKEQVMATVRALEMPALVFHGPGMLANHPQFGPFMVEFANDYVVVARDTALFNRTQLWTHATQLYVPTGPKEAWSPEVRAMYDAYLASSRGLQPWTDDRHSLVPLLLSR